jgi:hypothetical protein
MLVAMEVLFPGFQFPIEGWKHDGSVSSGKDMLYRGLKHVLVRTFLEAEQSEAYGTHYFLNEAGVTTVAIQKLRHVDGTYHYYVFADRDEMLRKKPLAFPNLVV